MAKLSDRFGRRNIYSIDVLLFMIGSVIIATTPSYTVVLIGRGVQGFGAGGIFPVASAVNGDTFPPDKRGGALGLIGAVFGLAFIIGPILGGILLQFSWQMLFWGLLPLAIVVLPLAWFTLPNNPSKSPGKADWAGTFVLGAFLLSLAYGLNQLDTSDIIASLQSLNVWPFLLLSIILLPILAVIDKHAEDPLIRPVLFSTRQLKLANLLSFGAGVVESSTVFIPALLVAAFGVTESKASFMLIPIVIALSIGSPTFGRLLNRKDSRFVILIGTSLLTIGMIGLGFSSLSTWLYYLSGIFIGFGLSALLGAPIRYIMINEAPANDCAAAQALISIQTKIGQMVTGALIGAVVTSLGGGVHGYTAAFKVLAIISLLLILVKIRFRYAFFS